MSASGSLAAIVIRASLAAMVIGLSFNNRATTITAMMHPIQARMSMTTPIPNLPRYNRENAGKQPVARPNTSLQNI
jgi:hypothetical protein